MEFGCLKVSDVWLTLGKGTRIVGVTSRESAEWQHPTGVTQTQVWGLEKGETPPTPFKKGFRIQREPESESEPGYKLMRGAAVLTRTPPS